MNEDRWLQALLTVCMVAVLAVTGVGCWAAVMLVSHFAG